MFLVSYLRSLVIILLLSVYECLAKKNGLLSTYSSLQISSFEFDFNLFVPFHLWITVREFVAHVIGN